MHKEIKIDYEEYQNSDELSKKDVLLLSFAKEALKRAFAPYSHFQVGAALLLDNGEIITGSNQENSAFPSGLCAERVAFFHATHRFPNAKIESIAVATYSGVVDTSHPTAPCGGCRQVLIDKELRDQNNIRCILSGSTGKVVVFRSFKDLMPYMEIVI
ncbi:MAG: cytidine deaminase [Bacteroidales bacterium]|jgi:cytidine deaminase|nr:cytidine deaminase [Bacteroidales bacterium]